MYGVGQIKSWLDCVRRVQDNLQMYRMWPMVGPVTWEDQDTVVSYGLKSFWRRNHRGPAMGCELPCSPEQCVRASGPGVGEPRSSQM